MGMLALITQFVFSQCSPNQAAEIATNTVLQDRSPRWYKERMWRITASRFQGIMQVLIR